jgi:hypothetical protein
VTSFYKQILLDEKNTGTVPIMNHDSGQQKHSDLADTEHYIFFSNTIALVKF